MQKIYHLFYIRNYLIKCHITKKLKILVYNIFNDAKQMIIRVGLGSIIIIPGPQNFSRYILIS